MRLMVCSSLLGMYPAGGNCLGLDCFDWGVLAVFLLVARAVSVTCCPGRQTVLWRAWCANSANDVFVVPPWKACAHTAEKESVLFSISDRPSQEVFSIWREEASLHYGVDSTGLIQRQ